MDKSSQRSLPEMLLQEFCNVQVSPEQVKANAWLREEPEPPHMYLQDNNRIMFYHTIGSTHEQKQEFLHGTWHQQGVHLYEVVLEATDFGKVAALGVEDETYCRNIRGRYLSFCREQEDITDDSTNTTDEMKTNMQYMKFTSESSFGDIPTYTRYSLYVMLDVEGATFHILDPWQDSVCTGSLGTASRRMRISCVMKGGHVEIALMYRGVIHCAQPPSLETMACRAAIYHLVPKTDLKPHFKDQWNITADAYREMYYQLLDASNEVTVRAAGCSLDM